MHEVLFSIPRVGKVPLSHVVMVVGLVCFNGPLGYAVEPLMLDRFKVRFQTKRDTGVYAVCGQSGFASGTHLLISRACASRPVTT